MKLSKLLGGEFQRVRFALCTCCSLTLWDKGHLMLDWGSSV